VGRTKTRERRRKRGNAKQFQIDMKGMKSQGEAFVSLLKKLSHSFTLPMLFQNFKIGAVPYSHSTLRLLFIRAAFSPP